MTATSSFVANILLREIGKSVDQGTLHMLAYEGGNDLSLPEAMVSVHEAHRVAKKFGDPGRHAEKATVSEGVLNRWVENFPTNEYGKQQAERALSATREDTTADMWTWLNELGGYLPKGATT